MMKYKVRGSDFALQLCIFLDIFDDFKAVMEKMQNLQSNIWLRVDLVPRLRSLLEERELALGQLQDLPDLKSLYSKLFHRTSGREEANTGPLGEWISSSSSHMSAACHMYVTMIVDSNVFNY